MADEYNTQSDQEMLDPSSIADEDNTQTGQEIQNLVMKLDEHYANLEQKRQVFENSIGSEIEVLNKDQNEARKLRHSLLYGSDDASSNLEAASQNIANVKQWLNENTLDSEDEEDQGNNFSVLIVDDDRTIRETNRRFMALAGTQKQLRMEFQEAKNGKEAVYLHLAGASFDLILMDNQMPIMTGIQLLRKMGVKSRIVGVTSEPDRQAFIDAGLNNCIQKPLNPGKVLWLIETTFVLYSAVHLCFHLHFLNNLHSYDFSDFPVLGLVLAKIDQSKILMVGMVLHINSCNFYILMVKATKPLILPSMADEDNTQIDREIQNLVNKLNERIAKLDQKRKVLENAKGSEIKALKKDRDEAWKLNSSLLNESGDTRQEIANVNNWLDHKTLLRGEDQHEGYNFSVLIVDDDLTVRDTNRRLMMSVETQQQLTMEFQEAKNGKEAVYLHLAGASYDLILMENHMPIMTGIQATQRLRKMGVKSQIVGVSSESDQQAFIDAGLDNCIQKPLDIAKITTFLSDPNKRRSTDTSQA
ncbi:hypothetical protein POTOM_014373 [Populus tomentosa]|uniref:Response regulatory domain-containing protein n=1 Tax=Populus tomentosa TaxID=118781 RepID=A0A8X8A7H4_POPTO|nr:hypothetical protein POTOM_014373 [Populus tomentosa]